METGYCLHCESLIDYASGASYCSAKCMDEALGYSDSTPVIPSRYKAPSPNSAHVARIRTGSRGSSAQRSDSRGRRSSGTPYDYSTSDVGGYESTVPTSASGMDDSYNSGLDDAAIASQVHFFAPRRLSVPSSPAKRLSPLLQPQSAGRSPGSSGSSNHSPSSLLFPPGRPRPLGVLPNRSPSSQSGSLSEGSAGTTTAALPTSKPISKKIRSRSKLASMHSATSSAPPSLSSTMTKRPPKLSRNHSSRGFFLGEDRSDFERDAGDADSELEISPKSPELLPQLRAGFSLRRISSGMSASGARTPTGAAKTVWSIAELSLDENTVVSEDEAGPDVLMPGKPEAESSDEEVSTRGRSRMISRRISLGGQ